jgi:hypothetical protein
MLCHGGVSMTMTILVILHLVLITSTCTVIQSFTSAVTTVRFVPTQQQTTNYLLLQHHHSRQQFDSQTFITSSKASKLYLFKRRRRCWTTTEISLSTTDSETRQQRATMNPTESQDDSHNENVRSSYNQKELSMDLRLSSNIVQTVDPCVVLMKQMIQKHQAEFEQTHRSKDSGTNDTGDKIYSLAQGVVYWDPPDECRTSILNALTDDSPTVRPSKLHLYSPDEGLLELRQLITAKLQRENQLTNHDVIVTSGANQAYMNCVTTLLSSKDRSVAVLFAPYYFNHYMALQMTIGTDNILVGNLTQQQPNNVLLPIAVRGSKC